MKRIRLLLVLCLLGSVLFSCKNVGKAYIEGAYANYASGEYSIAKDTIVIQAYGDKGDYQVIRKSCYQAIHNGKLQPQKRELHKFIGHFDPKTKVLLIDSQGKRISFFPDKGSILVNQREYQKVSQH